MPLINRPNHVPELQRKYQAAYKGHTRLWKIPPGSKFYMTPYYVVLYGSLAASLYAAGRRVAGYNSFFGS